MHIINTILLLRLLLFNICAEITTKISSRRTRVRNQARPGRKQLNSRVNSGNNDGFPRMRWFWEVANLSSPASTSDLCSFCMDVNHTATESTYSGSSMIEFSRHGRGTSAISLVKHSVCLSAHRVWAIKTSSTFEMSNSLSFYAQAMGSNEDALFKFYWWLFYRTPLHVHGMEQAVWVLWVLLLLWMERDAGNRH